MIRLTSKNRKLLLSAVQFGAMHSDSWPHENPRSWRTTRAWSKRYPQQAELQEMPPTKRGSWLLSLSIHGLVPESFWFATRFKLRSTSNKPTIVPRFEQLSWNKPLTSSCFRVEETNWNQNIQPHSKRSKTEREFFLNLGWIPKVPNAPSKKPFARKRQWQGCYKQGGFSA